MDDKLLSGGKLTQLGHPLLGGPTLEAPYSARCVGIYFYLIKHLIVAANVIGSVPGLSAGLSDNTMESFEYNFRMSGLEITIVWDTSLAMNTPEAIKNCSVVNN